MPRFLRFRARLSRRSHLGATAVLLAGLLTGQLVFRAPEARAAVRDVPDETWVVNGDVHSVVQAGGRIYLGGSFDQVGPSTGGGVGLYRGTGGWVATMPKINGVVHTVVPDGSGGFYVGGDFTRVGDKSRQNAARVLADGTVGAWNPNTDRPVRAIVISPAGRIAWIGGDFRVVNKTLDPAAASGLAATNLVSGAAVWSLAGSTVGSVSALTLSGDGSRLYVGGDFTSLAGVPRSRLAAVDAGTGAIDAGFNPGADGVVNTLAVGADGRLFVGGDFGRLGGVDRSRLAAVTTSGAVDPSWRIEASGSVNVITPAPLGDRLYVGGDFTSLGGVERNRLALVHLAGGGTVEDTWDPGAAVEVRAIAVSPDAAQVYVGGGDDSESPSLVGPPRRVLMALDALSGARDVAFDPRPAAATRAVGVSESLLYAGGEFTSVNGVARANLAALDATSGSLDLGFVADTDGAVNAVVSDGTHLYAGGVFNAVNNVTRRRLVRLSADTGAVTSAWQASASSSVDSLVLSGSSLYVGGTFSTVGGAARSKLARVSANTGAVDAWGPSLDAAAQSMVLSPDQRTLYVAGDFTSVGVVARQKLAAIDISTGVPTAWLPKPKVPLTSVAISGDGSLAFVAARGNQKEGNRIQAYSTVSGALAWERLGDGDFQAVDVGETVVYAGGHFTRIDDQVRGHLAAFDQKTGALHPWAPTISGVHGVLDLEVRDGVVLVAGEFHKVSGLTAQGIARFAVDGDDSPPTTTTTEPSTTTALAGPTTTTAPVGASTASARSGYWMVEASGNVYPFGDARSFGNAILPSGVQAVDLEPTPSGKGYWIVDSRGAVYAFGDAARLGSLDRSPLVPSETATSVSATPSGQGYWIFTSRGRVVPFGDAAPFGDLSAVRLNGPVLDSIPTPSGRGYYMVASDGGIFAFGDARFFGSMGGRRLNAAVQSLVPDADGAGYWLVASDGGVFAFDAPYKGSMGATRLNKPVTGMVRFGDGYLMVGEDGGIFNFSSRPFFGSLGDRPPLRPIVSVAPLD